MTAVTTPEDGIAAQVRNIEARYGKPMSHWFAVIAASGLAKHTDQVAMLKTGHQMTHGAVHRVCLLARQAAAAGADQSPPAAGMVPASDTASAARAADAVYTGKKAVLRPLHDQLMSLLAGFGADVMISGKRGYLSIRRKKQFAMLQPSGAGRIDVGLILREVQAAGRLEPSGSFNALFTHRVRVTSADDIDAALAQWLRSAYYDAG
jgi:hypothetical protein